LVNQSDAYEANANVSSVANPARRQTKYTYDTPAQVVHDFYVVVTGGTGVLVHNEDEPPSLGCDDEPMGTAGTGAGTAGPLSDSVAATFRGGKYASRTLNEDTTFYRAGSAGTDFPHV
jgi:hypothetical protein